jgi:hypothetical protein
MGHVVSIRGAGVTLQLTASSIDESYVQREQLRLKLADFDTQIECLQRRKETAMRRLKQLERSGRVT